jgi:glucosamine--fructose-6-phosphate aminotransferase (isomerizing)
VALVPGGPTHDKMLSNVQEAKARGGRVIAIGSPDDAALRALVESPRDVLIPLPSCPELWSPFLTVIPLQLLAYHVALRAGRDVDQPRNLAKSVTVE